MRVAIVNSARATLNELRAAITASGRYEVCWAAGNGEEALSRIAEDLPDLLLIDVLLDGKDGVAVTRQVMRSTPCAILIATDSVDKTADRVFQALQAGALDAVGIPGPDGPVSDAWTETLQEKLEMFERLLRPRPPATSNVTLVAVGASAGGPGAVGRVLAALPTDFGGAVVIVQHIDEAFTEGLVTHLSVRSALPVRVAETGDVPRQGEVLVAGRSGHLVLDARGRLRYTRQPEAALHRPSIDALFASLSSWKGPLIGVLLTGMGSDGAQGLLALRRAGHWTVAQDEGSSAVYGMPKAAANLNAACDILPLDQIGPALGRRVSAGSGGALSRPSKSGA